MNKFIYISFFFFALFTSSPAFAQRQAPDYGAGWHSGSIAAGCNDYRQNCSGEYLWDDTNNNGYSRGYRNGGEVPHYNPRGGYGYQDYQQSGRGYDRRGRYNEYDRNRNVVVVGLQTQGGYGYGQYDQQQCNQDSNHPVLGLLGTILNAGLNTSHSRYANALGAQCFGNQVTSAAGQVSDSRQNLRAAYRNAEAQCQNQGGRVVGYQGGVQCEYGVVASNESTYVQQCVTIDFHSNKTFQVATPATEQQFRSACNSAGGDVARKAGACQCLAKK